VPPPGWQPPPGWKPDPSWPEPPDGWQLWIEEPPPRSGPSKRTWGLLGAATALVGLVIAFGAWFYPDFNDPNKVSSDEKRAEYDATVNALCQDVLDDLGKIDPNAIDDLAHARDTSQRVSDLYDRLLQRWSALEPPVPGDEPAIRSMLDALERISRAFADMSFAFTLSSPALLRQAFAQASEAEDQAGADFRSAAGLYGGVDTCVTLGR
jgi:hypothetical protein